MLFEFRVHDLVWLDSRFIASQRPSKLLEYKKLGPFRITRSIKNTAFELDLSTAPALKGIHPVFHPWLLHLHDREPIPEQIVMRPDPEPATEEDTREGLRYEATAVVDSKMDSRMKDPALGRKWKDKKSGKEGCLMYKITYVGWDEWNKAPRWQPYTDAVTCPNLVADFHHDNPNKPGPHDSFSVPEDWTALLACIFIASLPAEVKSSI